MGRYDKVKVYYNGEWKPIKELRVYNNKWVTLGTNDSDNQTPGYTYKADKLTRFTLNKKVTNVPTGVAYVSNDAFSIWPANGYCFCPFTADGAYGGATFEFSCRIRKTKAGNKRLFWSGIATNAILIHWLEEGTILVEMGGTYDANGNLTNPQHSSFKSTNAVGKNVWVNLTVYCAKGSYRPQIIFDGVSTVHKGYTYTFQKTTATNLIGDDGIDFTGNIIVSGSQYLNGSNVVNQPVTTLSKKVVNATGQRIDWI